MCDVYFQIPSTPEDCMTIAKGFEKRWNFRNCIGAMDGKHINILAPRNSGIMFSIIKEHLALF